MLSAAQQERFARHLLVDELGGDGQERLLTGTVVVKLPDLAATTALWAVRYLAASGLGALVLEGSWAAGAARECARFWPAVRVQEGSSAAPAGAVCIVGEEGVAAAAAGVREGAAARNGEGPQEIAVAWRGLPLADAAALGAQAALEALKRIAGAGRAAPLPLRNEAAP